MRVLHAQQILQEMFKVLHFLGVQDRFVEWVAIEAVETQVKRGLDVRVLLLDKFQSIDIVLSHTNQPFLGRNICSCKSDLHMIYLSRFLVDYFELAS